MEKTASNISERAVNRRPQNTTSSIIEEESAPRHVINTSQERGPGAKKSNEATKKDRFISMFSKICFCESEMLRLDKHIFTIAYYKGPATGTPNYITDVVSYDCSKSCA